MYMRLLGVCGCGRACARLGVGVGVGMIVLEYMLAHVVSICFNHRNNNDTPCPHPYITAGLTYREQTDTSIKLEGPSGIFASTY